MPKRKRRRKGQKDKMPEAEGDEDVLEEMSKSRKRKSVEQTYQKKSPVEHILLRPDTYVGSTEKQEETLWIWNDKKHEMEHKDIEFVPALYKIFDEILVNAADNMQRDPKMSCIKVDIDQKKGRIKVWNDGKGLPIQVHKKHKVFVPELVFGHLLTSDNYDDSERKVTGGRNGYGAKLTNIFSKKFKIETADNNKRYAQEWENNMGKKGKPMIKKHAGKPYTCVEFWPDFKKFGMTGLDNDTAALMQRRAFDVAGTCGERVTVHLNGKKLPVKSFADYCGLFHSGDGAAYAKIGKRWEILVATSDGDGFHQCSFVNSISTPKGGTHVQYILDQLCDAIISKGKKAAKGTEIKRIHVKTHLWVFINCLIENPAFSSQTKEMMTLKVGKFGSTCNLSPSFISEILEQTGILDVVVKEAQAKLTIAMDTATKSGSRTGKRVLGVPKLEDANDAGGKDSSKCTLILTEGDSAKALAVAGLAVVGRDRYGVFPLRGKPLNVRDVTQAQVQDNKEIMNIVKILGLSFGKAKGYEKDMRYGSVMIMADQDYDGSHIKGLLINLFHHWWPKLMKKPGFIQEFITPIVKVTKDGKTITFFTLIEYEKWKKRNDNGKGWNIKYYKGLGTSTAAEGKEYFKDIKNHEIKFKFGSAADGKLIDMAFNKSRADDRKKWMNKYVEGTFVNHAKSVLSYKDFINLELVQFSRYDVMRSIPSVMDGLKPTQRKILFGCFKRNLRKDVKVAQLVGYIAEHASYHHGEASLSGSIISMAQDFVGSNNINLLVPSGQFGTRIMGGKDHASARYIYTRLSPLTRLIYSPLDDPVLDYLNEEGQRIEPYWYVPIIPMVLVNGAEGIGTGWATSIPNYNPLEVIENMRLFIKRKKMKTMAPWYRGFQGAIKKVEKGKYDSVGIWQEGSRGAGIEVTELPIRRWTQDYKEFLQTLLPGSDKKSKIQISECREYHTEDRVHFSLRCTGADLKTAKAAEGGVEGFFRLKTAINETNMVLFDKDGKITKYKDVVAIMAEFAKVRLKYYDIRKKYMVDKLQLERDLLSNRARFIGMIIAKKLHINNRKKADVVRDLTRLKFKKFGDSKAPRTGYEYLLIMHIVSLTLERKQELEKLLDQKTKELGILKKTTIQKMWEQDLDRLEAGIKAMIPQDDAGSGGTKRKSSDVAKKLKLWKGAKGRKGKGRKGKKGALPEEEDDDDGEGGGGGDAAEGEEAPAADEGVFGSHFSDVGRWTSGHLKLPKIGIRKKAKFT
mmetsp:Transcript_25018/g.40199  ORF Transcript_25018/g.40199 Transcript_25018/m.40199 type:complete len:1246 (+) Transcript_25018:79-3816(+)